MRHFVGEIVYGRYMDGVVHEYPQPVDWETLEAIKLEGDYASCEVRLFEEFGWKTELRECAEASNGRAYFAVPTEKVEVGMGDALLGAVRSLDAARENRKGLGNDDAKYVENFDNALHEYNMRRRDFGLRGIDIIFPLDRVNNDNDKWDGIENSGEMEM